MFTIKCFKKSDTKYLILTSPKIYGMVLLYVFTILNWWLK